MPEETTQPVVTDGGTGAPVVTETPKPWLEQVEQSLRGNEALKDFNGPNDVVKGYLGQREELAALKGKLEGTIKPPGEGSTQAEKDAYYTALGRPEKPDDYEIKPSDGMPQNPELLGLFKNWAFELGFSKDQASGLSARWDSFMGKMAESQRAADTKALVEGQEALKKEWGAAYDANAETVKKAFTAFKSESFNKFLETEVEMGGTKIKIGNHPAIMAAFLDVGKKMLPDNAPPGSGTVVSDIKPGITYPDMPKT
jgi:hypothetical protein